MPLETKYCYVLVGAGDLAREVQHLLLRECHGVADAVRVAYYDDSRQEPRPDDLGPVLCQLDDVIRTCPPDLWRAIITVGLPRPRAALYEQFRAAGYQFSSVISPNATVETNHLGPGTIVFPGARLAIGVEVGANVLISYNAVIGHDTRLGDHSVVYPGVQLAGRIQSGEQVQFGIGSSVIQRRRIGAGAVVAAGSSVWIDVPPGVTVMGVPARVRSFPSSSSPNPSDR